MEGLTRIALSVATAAVLTTVLMAPTYAVTPDEIKARGKLIVGVLTDFPPYAGVDDKQQPAGYDMDVAKLMAEDLGVKLEAVPVTGPNRIPYLLTNRIDMLVAVLGVTAERAKQVAFSNPYSTLDIMVMAPKKLDIKEPKDLAKYTIGVTRAGSQDTLVSAIAPPGTKILRYDDDFGLDPGRNFRPDRGPGRQQHSSGDPDQTSSRPEYGGEVPAPGAGQQRRPQKRGHGASAMDKLIHCPDSCRR